MGMWRCFFLQKSYRIIWVKVLFLLPLHCQTIKQNNEEIQSERSHRIADSRRMGGDEAKAHKWRPPAVQTPDKAGKGDSQRKGQRSIEPVPSQQHLETGGVEIATLPASK